MQRVRRRKVHARKHLRPGSKPIAAVYLSPLFTSGRGSRRVRDGEISFLFQRQQSQLYRSVCPHYRVVPGIIVAKAWARISRLVELWKPPGREHLLLFARIRTVENVEERETPRYVRYTRSSVTGCCRRKFRVLVTNRIRTASFCRRRDRERLCSGRTRARRPRGHSMTDNSINVG